MRKTILGVLFLIGISAGFGEQPQAQLVTRDQPYRLQPSDVLEIEYQFTPEYNQTATVEPDGSLSLNSLDMLRLQD